ncbi:MAG: glycoside hydrolase family 3 C-terminal domain-containing protein [Bifidobacteriaceae bacterium]|jgi:beta-glucosidase|nr:glycoside hydrolase family 3 C-terminal domain-containing protein [Bifidobacteriaceae bacterium]
MGERDLDQILQALTLEEKAGLGSGLNDHFTKPVERLGIGSIEVEDGPHGLRRQLGDDALARGQATCFPADVATASSWNPEVARRVGQAIGRECRAEGVSVILGPAMNIKRTPLSGRNFEYFSEDPYLSGKMAAAYVRGVQGEGVGACLKHFAANNQEFSRMCVDAKIGQRALREIYLRGFEIAVREAAPMTIMAAYNKINGVYCTENKQLLTDILRGEWGFDGIVMSDWGAVNRRESAVAAGLDLEMPSSYGYGDRRVVKAVKQGRLEQADLDAAARRMLKFVFAAQDALAASPKPVIDADAQHGIARQLAEECVVLLQNRGPILPLATQAGPDGPRRLAIVGGLAKHPRYQGGGSSNVNVRRFDVPFDEIAGRAGGAWEVAYAPGYPAEDNDVFFSLEPPSSPSARPDRQLIADAVARAERADVAIVFAGLPETVESEGFDRADMRLPAGQEELVTAVLKAQPNTIVVLNNGSPVEMPWADQAKAIVESYLGGQGGAFALARILFGEVSPSGKLAETIPRRLSDTPGVRALSADARQTEYGEGIMVGYRYYDAKGVEPAFAFGHGLSYTTFEYSNLTIARPAVFDDETVEATVDVANTGGVAGAEVVQLYVSFPAARVLRPKQELKGFAKVFLEPGETRTVAFSLGADAFARWDETAEAWLVDAGDYELRAAASSRDIRLVATVLVANRQPRHPVFDLNTPIGEIAVHPGARAMLVQFVKPFIKTSFLRQLPGTAEEITDQLITRFGDMPLRSLALTGNQLPTKAIERLTEVLNRAARGKKGLGLLFK